MFRIETREEQDEQFIQAFNSRSNRNRFNLLFQNCADFVRQAINFYYPHAVGRNFSADLGIMTPAQAAKRVVRFGKKHRDLQLSGFIIDQVPGTVPRSKPVRGVLESLMRSKRYVIPLAPLAVLHPAVGGGMAYAWVEGSHFNPRQVAAAVGGVDLEPEQVAAELLPNGGASFRAEPRQASAP
jgi:hypothetical protein